MKFHLSSIIAVLMIATVAFSVAQANSGRERNHRHYVGMKDSSGHVEDTYQNVERPIHPRHHKKPHERPVYNGERECSDINYSETIVEDN